MTDSIQQEPWEGLREATVGELLRQQKEAGQTAAEKETLARRLVDALTRPAAYWLFHSGRLFGYGFMFPFGLYFKPLQTVGALAAYAVVHRQRFWQRAVHQVLGHGASRKHRIVNAYKHLISDDKRYLWCLHPHSILVDGWHSIIARNLNSFEGPGIGEGPPEIGRRISLCFAPVIQHVPVHQEMYRESCGGADKKSIERWWNTSPPTDPALVPGGFAESIFADAGQQQVEHSYIKDRKGFVKIAIEGGKDMVPIYTFKSNWMYHNPGFLRGLRAKYSQKISVGIALPFGKFGTAMPVRDDTVTVVFPPFEASRYTVDQLEVAHAAYMAHLKEYFDKHKAECGMGHVELVFVGKDFQDDDAAARALRRIGVLGKQVKKKGEPEPPRIMSKL